MRLLPLSITPEFRKMLAELSRGERLEWMAALGRKIEARAAERANGDPWSRDFESSAEVELFAVARACRAELVSEVQEKIGPFDARCARALLEVPRERFVRASDIDRSADDTPLPLDDEGLATISAPHAYVLSFRLLELARGDRLLELGSGSGYGAALAEHIVGSEGRVTSVEIDQRLAGIAANNLRLFRNVEVRCADAMAELRPVDATKIVVTFAVDAIASSWIDVLPEGGALVAPVGQREQRLVCMRRVRGELRTSEHGAVRYVQNRSKR